MTIKITEGAATVTVLDDEVVALGDRVTKGAVSSFLRAARGVMSEVVDEAIPLWPVKTGRSRDSMRIDDRLTTDRISVIASNASGYGYFIKYSLRTKEQLDAEAKRVGYNAGTDAAERTETRIAYATFARKFNRRASPGELAAFWRSRLTRFHGKGAPSERVAGKNVWAWQVKRPAKQHEAELIAEARADLDELAKG
tara:strand:+ start:8 stop:598 length:591 start_codon:yes stop_codon:yes gene_type:complete